MREKHKHYYCIRAYADGWEIESKSSVGWEHIPRPFFDRDREYRVVPDKDGWLPWYGGECPVAAGTMVDVRYRRVLVEEKAAYAHLSRWEHLPCDDDIVAYRVVEEAKADPYAELKATRERLSVSDELLREEFAQKSDALAVLREIGDFANDRSTGPSVEDDLWEVRNMAYAILTPFAMVDASVPPNCGYRKVK